MGYTSIFSNPATQPGGRVSNPLPSATPPVAGGGYQSVFPTVPPPAHINALADSLTNEQRQLKLQQLDNAVKQNTTGSFLKNLKIAGPKADIRAAATAGRETAQSLARPVAELAVTAGSAVGIHKQNPNKVGQFLFGKGRIQTIPEKGVGAAEAHPGGFHIKGTPITLSPTATGLTEAASSGALDLAQTFGLGKGIVKAGDRVGTEVQGAKTAVKNTAVNQVLKNAAEANKPSAPSPVNKIVSKSQAIKSTVESQAPPATKLLSAGKPVSAEPIKGEGFTMSDKANPTAVAAGKRVAQINKTLADVSSGKKAATGAEIRSLMQEKQAIADKVHSEAPIPEVPVGKPSELPTAPKSPATPVKIQTEPVVGKSAETPPSASRTEKPNVVQSTPTEVTAAPEDTVKVPSSQLPVGAGKERASALENRIQTTLRNIPEEDRSKISTYNAMNKQENIAAAAKFVDKNPEDAMAVLRGEKNPPSGLAHNSIYLALDAKSAGDPQLALKLASLRSTRAGQEISLLSEANPYSPAKHISEIQNLRIEKAGGRKVITREAGDIKKAVRAATKAPTKQDWNSFVESLKC